MFASVRGGSGGTGSRGTSAAFGAVTANSGSRPLSAAQARAARQRERSTRPIFGNPRFIERAKDKLRDTFNPEDEALAAERESEVAEQQLLLKLDALCIEKDRALEEYRDIYAKHGAARAQASAAYRRFTRMKKNMAVVEGKLEVLGRSSEAMQNALADEITVGALSMNNRATAASRQRQREQMDFDEIIDDTDEVLADQEESDRRFLEDFTTINNEKDALAEIDPSTDPELAEIHESIEIQHALEDQQTRESLLDLPPSRIGVVSQTASRANPSSGNDDDDLESWLSS